MAKTTFPYRFLAIEGNIGAGKTTLSQRLAEEFECRLILEQFTDNPFLPPFYENPERYAFPVELFFLTERYKQLQDELQQTDIFQQGVIADYFFSKTLLFARNNLPPAEYRLFQQLFQLLQVQFPRPDLLVYLHRPIPQLLHQIEKRGRDFENPITPTYLEQIQSVYFDYFRVETQQPVLVLELQDWDFAHNPAHYAQVKEWLFAAYGPGIHYRSPLMED